MLKVMGKTMSIGVSRIQTFYAEKSTSQQMLSILTLIQIKWGLLVMPPSVQHEIYLGPKAVDLRADANNNNNIQILSFVLRIVPTNLADWKRVKNDLFRNFRELFLIIVHDCLTVSALPLCPSQLIIVIRMHKTITSTLN
jgi:hypothetical protein